MSRKRISFFIIVILIAMFAFGGCGGGGGDGGGSPKPQSPTLSNLQLSSGTLSSAFNSTTRQYTASVANSVTSITVTPTTTASATITVNGTNVPSGNASGAIILNLGTNTITIVVANAAGSTTYTVTVTRDIGSAPRLSSLQLSAGTLASAFSSTTTSYTVSVGNAVASTTVTPATTTAGAAITVNGTSVNSGSASGAIALNVGSNTITIVVGNASGSTTYTVTVTREMASAAPRLSDLVLSAGVFTPGFSPTTTTYTANVSNSVTSTTVRPTTTTAGATITVNGTNVISGNASGAIALSVGLNNITVIVTSGAGSTTYTVRVTRADPERLQGSFVDGRVEGLAFTCTPSNGSGVTCENGLYQYMPGDRIVFKLGNITLPQILATNVISPYSYCTGTTTSATDVLTFVRFMMSAGTVQANGNIKLSANPFGGASGSYPDILSNSAVITAMAAITEAQAKTHFERALFNEYAGDWLGTWRSNSGAESGTWNFVIVSDRSISGYYMGSSGRVNVTGNVTIDGDVTVTGGGVTWNGKIKLATLELSGTIGSGTGTFEGIKIIEET